MIRSRFVNGPHPFIAIFGGADAIAETQARRRAVSRERRAQAVADLRRALVALGPYVALAELRALIEEQRRG